MSCDEYVALQVVSLANRVLASFWCVVRVLQHRRSQASCLDCFPNIDTQTLDFISGDTSVGVTALMLALVTLGKSTSLEAIEATRLLHVSTLPSHLRATQM